MDKVTIAFECPKVLKEKLEAKLEEQFQKTFTRRSMTAHLVGLIREDLKK